MEPSHSKTNSRSAVQEMPRHCRSFRKRSEPVTGPYIESDACTLRPHILFL